MPVSQRIGQFHNFDRAGTMRKTTDETPLLKCGDQPVDARLGPQIKRFLHLVKRGGYAIALQPRLDEIQKIELFLGQHRVAPSGSGTGRKWTKPCRTGKFPFVLPLFPFCVNSPLSALSRGQCDSGRTSTLSPAARGPSLAGRNNRAFASDSTVSRELS